MINSFHLLLLIFLFVSIRGQITPNSGVLASAGGPTGLRLGEVKDSGKNFEILVLNGVAATWGQWDSWSACTGSCDIGIQQRRRECRQIVVIGQAPGSDIGTRVGCFGYKGQIKGCALRPCVGIISPWSQWSPCSVEVGDGVQMRTRICVGPGECVQDTFDIRGCKSVSRYSWTGWTAYTVCTVSCGGGQSVRTRRCAAPDGSHAANISQCSDPLNLGFFQFRACWIRCGCPEHMFECDDGHTCIEGYQFCDGHRDCRDGWDEEYATDEDNNNLTLCRGTSSRGGLRPLCILPLESEKHRNSLCADEIHCWGGEFECRNPTSKCIPATYFCDGFNQCSDGSDEITSSPAANSGYRACLGRQVSRVVRQPCQLSEEYFCDGEPICYEGTDECLCGEKHKDHIDNVCFRCFGNSATHIPIKKVCNGLFDCPDLTDECLCPSTIRPDICESLEWKEEKPYLRCNGSNNSIWVDVIAGQVCDIKSERGVDEKIRLCGFGPLWVRGCSPSENGNRECSYMILTSTPLDTCPGDIVNCMTFLDQDQFAEINSNSSDSWITCNVYLTSSSHFNIQYDCTSVNYQKISTIKECKNQGVNGYFTSTCNCSYFKCDDDNGEKYIDGKAVCDGFADCRSGTDECQPGCIVSAFSDEKSLIRNKGFMTLVWIFSIIAIIGCTSVVASTLHGIVQSARRDGNNDISSHSNINKLLVMSLSISDLLVGIYTMAICIKAIEVEGKYCKVDVEWRAGTTCSILGALLIIGSEQSVFTMVLITIFRLNAVMRPLASPKLNRAFMGVAICWFISILIGSLPLIRYLEDYFLTDVSFNDTVLFKTEVNQNDKQHLIKWLSFLNNGSGVEHGDSTEWGQLRKLISQINIYSPIKSTYEFGYYSSHTVCLPTFFPDRNKDGSWAYSFALLVLNIVAFVFMLVCYIALYRKATNRKIVKSSTARNKRDEQSAAMQRKLTRILASDFLCWVPVCIMGFLQVAGIDIPPDAYLPTGLFILPINSAMNPFLYSDLPDLILSQGRRSFTWVAESFRRWRNRGTSPETPPAEVQALELNVLEVQDEASQRLTELTC